MNTNLELENIVDEMIQEGILDRVEARAAGMFAGAKQMGQNVKGVFTGGPTKGYGQQYGEVKFNNRINQFLKQAQKDLAEFEAKYGADLSKTKMSEDAKTTAIAQIAEIKKAIATAQESAGERRLLSHKHHLNSRKPQLQHQERKHNHLPQLQVNPLQTSLFLRKHRVPLRRLFNQRVNPHYQRVEKTYNLPKKKTNSKETGNWHGGVSSRSSRL